MQSFSTNTITRRSTSPRCVAQLLLPTTVRSIYETPNGLGFSLASMILCNGTGNRVSVRVHHVAARDSAVQRNALVYDLALQPYSSIVLEMPVYLLAGDALHAVAGAASSISMSVYGEEA